MYLRVTVLMLFFQAECVEEAWWVWAYLGAKAILLFQIGFEKQQGVELVCMLVVFHLLDYVTSLIPFMPLLFWYVNLAYFLYGIEEKYLSLNLMTLPIPLLSKSLVVTYPSFYQACWLLEEPKSTHITPT
jgi:hypothetical protein